MASRFVLHCNRRIHLVLQIPRSFEGVGILFVQSGGAPLAGSQMKKGQEPRVGRVLSLIQIDDLDTHANFLAKLNNYSILLQTRRTVFPYLLVLTLLQ